MGFIRVAICDDDPKDREKYAAALSKVARETGREAEILRYDSAETLLSDAAQASFPADILYLDVMMEPVDGIETARRLRKLGCIAPIVFLTNSEDQVFSAFDVNALNYLLKYGTDDEQFRETFRRAVAAAAENKNEYFACEFDRSVNVIPLRDIAYFEIWGRTVTVHYGQGQLFKFNARIKQLEEKLTGQHFVRVHRSYIVHLPYIAMFRKKELLLKNGAAVPVGETYGPSLRQAFSDYMSRHQVFSFIKDAPVSDGPDPSRVRHEEGLL